MPYDAAYHTRTRRGLTVPARNKLPAAATIPVALRTGPEGFAIQGARTDDRTVPWRAHALPGLPVAARTGTDPPAEASGGMAATEDNPPGANPAPGDAPAAPLQ